jgi:hypothetical protein
LRAAETSENHKFDSLLVIWKFRLLHTIEHPNCNGLYTLYYSIYDYIASGSNNHKSKRLGPQVAVFEAETGKSVQQYCVPSRGKRQSPNSFNRITSDGDACRLLPPQPAPQIPHCRLGCEEALRFMSNSSSSSQIMEHASQGQHLRIMYSCFLSVA